MAEQAALWRGNGDSAAAAAALSTARNPINSIEPMMPTGNCSAIARVRQLIGQVAPFDSNVLVLGESGTGKEVVARAIHEASPRRARAFVPINCGAIPAELLESELFGHEKGAFTGALSARKGRFEIAEGGTIFLDEIGDMNPSMQVKLLRVLQERIYERVGSCVSQRCNVRVIAATHRDLEQAIAQGSFREDLYYRLHVVPIEMPPLRERTDDLSLLVEALLERHAASGQPTVRFNAAALAALRAYRWPGNVRELGNLLERMAVQYGGRIVGVEELPARYRPAHWEASAATSEPVMLASIPAADLLALALPPAEPATVTAPPERSVNNGSPALGADGEEEAAPMDATFAEALLAELPPGFDLRAYLESLERRLIERALESAGGTVAHAARLLGLRRTTLVEKLRKYALGGSEALAES